MRTHLALILVLASLAIAPSVAADHGPLPPGTQTKASQWQVATVPEVVTSQNHFECRTLCFIDAHAYACCSTYELVIHDNVGNEVTCHADGSGLECDENPLGTLETGTGIWWTSTLRPVEGPFGVYAIKWFIF